jgi:hypothetical protein
VLHLRHQGCCVVILFIVEELEAISLSISISLGSTGLQFNSTSLGCLRFQICDDFNFKISSSSATNNLSKPDDIVIVVDVVVVFNVNVVIGLKIQLKLKRDE